MLSGIPCRSFADDSASIGAGVLAALQSPQPPPAESLLTTLINEIATVPENFFLVLDDYHMIDAKAG